MTHALVTGGTGFIGGCLVDRLLAEGWRVTLLARDPGRMQARHAGLVSVLAGDLREALPPFPPLDLVVHCAADMNVSHSLAQMATTTVAGTERVLDAARQAGVGRFVHVSSQAVYGFDRHYHDADESTPLRPSPYAYCESKRLAELAVWQARERGLPVTVVRPGFVYGVGEMNTFPPVLKALKAGQISAYIDGGEFDTGCVHVENCVDGIFRAATVPQAVGEAYHLGDGRVLTIKQMVESVCSRLDLTPPSRRLPFGLAMALATGVAAVWRLGRLPGMPPMSPFVVAMLRRNSGFSIEKARDHLGYEPRRQWEEGLDEVLAWCAARERGELA